MFAIFAFESFPMFLVWSYCA